MMKPAFTNSRRAFWRQAGATENPTIKSVETFVVEGACFVKVTASNGVAGWGEADTDNAPLMAAFIHNGLKQRVLGESVWDTERLWDAMFYKNHDQGPGGALANSIAGIDIALWDLKGRLLGLPVYQLLGGMYRDRIRVYGSFGVGFGRSMTVAQAAAQAKKFVERGFTAVKLRMQIRQNNQNPEPDPTFEYARAVRQAIGPDVDFLIDINNGYSAARAIETARRLKQEFNIWFLEEPVSDQTHAETAAVVKAVDTPIIAGEKEYTRWQLRELIVYGQPDYLNPDTIKAGGLTEMKKIAAIAQAYGKPIICHNTRPTLGTAASLHFVASIPNCGPLMEFVDVDKFEFLRGLMKNDVRFEKGYLFVPQGVGLGMEVDEEKVRRATNQSGK
ncbi:MAG: mandelate racemase/muconate lactonizing enzyme family protein [Acidobacteriota bacterium]|nr:mandelate racemase/muconate lactonizing enzyme family protein [Acidobacteriota bacterium]